MIMHFKNLLKMTKKKFSSDITGICTNQGDWGYACTRGVIAIAHLALRL